MGSQIIPTGELGSPFQETEKPTLEPTAATRESAQIMASNSLPEASARANLLFPPIPEYGHFRKFNFPSNLGHRLVSGFLCAVGFSVLVICALLSRIPSLFRPASKRPLNQLEKERSDERKQKLLGWKARQEHEYPKKKNQHGKQPDEESDNPALKNSIGSQEFVPTEGGPDPLKGKVPIYAHRVGLECETFLVQTEDGFIIELWHLYNPLISQGNSESERAARVSTPLVSLPKARHQQDVQYPVMLLHGLLQSSGAYCCTDDNSLAFYLAKQGLDVWLGNNRCGMDPKHAHIQHKPSDPRMWSWDIRHMATKDLPALISRVCETTGFEKVALVAHSQGTTQTLIALAKHQVPELGERLSVACLLAPAIYAGPLLQTWVFKAFGVLSHAGWHWVFGIHAFIQSMMSIMGVLPVRMFGLMGYIVFNFMFKWSDTRWDRELRTRGFLFAPTYVSSEHMWWWLGQEEHCFAQQRCVLNTRQEVDEEDAEDKAIGPRETNSEDIERAAWFDTRVPPLALWVAGRDELVDGPRLLRRFEKGREPHVEIAQLSILTEYEHLDVLWAMDAIDLVGKEVLETVWKTTGDARLYCKTPKGCENIEPWEGRRG